MPITREISFLLMPSHVARQIKYWSTYRAAYNRRHHYRRFVLPSLSLSLSPYPASSLSLSREIFSSPDDDQEHTTAEAERSGDFTHGK